MFDRVNQFLGMFLSCLGFLYRDACLVKVGGGAELSSEGLKGNKTGGF